MAAKKRYWIGFDLGGTKMLAALFDGRFNIVASRRRRMKDFRGARSGMEGIRKTIDQVLEEAGITKAQLGGIGVGCPGVLDLSRGVLLRAPNLGWRNLALRSVLRKHYGCPVVLLNDVDAGTYAEYRWGAGRRARCVLGVFPGTGVGGACVYEGKLLCGRTSSCMEIGHILAQPQGNLCGCGRWGCLETVASRLAISARAAEAASRGSAPSLLENSGTQLSSIRSRALAKSILAGDQAVAEVVNQAACHLGVAIASVVNLLAPDVVVLGGGLVEALPQPFLREARRAIREQAMQPFRKTRVVAAHLGDNATVLGAAILAAESSRRK